MTSNGIVIRTSVKGISIQGRSTQGVKVVNLNDGDGVTDIAIINEEDNDK